MRLVTKLLWALLIVACSEVTSGTTAPITITIGTGPPRNSRVPLEGVGVCEMDTTNCAVTDVQGVTTLELPLNQETVYTLDKQGYASWLEATVISADQTALAANMPTAQDVADDHARVMSPYPMRDTGTVGVQLIPGYEGATFELVAATGNAFYMDEAYDWSSDLTSTTFVGIGGFAEVTPGEVQVDIGGSAEACVRSGGGGGWPSGEEDRIRVPIRDGYVTLAVVTCPLP